MHLTDILETHAFTIVFQPIVRLADRRTMGYEALTRFTDGSRPDDRFVEAAGLGLKPALELAAMRAAVLEARTLPSTAPLFLNISPSVLASDMGPIVSLIHATPHIIILELSEREVIEHPDRLRMLIADNLPTVGIALDDVGSGHADIDRIHDLAPAYVKLDRDLVMGMTTGGSRRAEGERLLLAAATMRSQVIAEGIETEADALRMAALGVGCGQGWALGRPDVATRWAS